jgi:hypothetical protein
VRVDFRRKQDSLAANVLVPLRRDVGMPSMAAELTIGGLDELVALFVVLADEQHERWGLPLAK